MTMFDDRQKAQENKYAHDKELSFKINARRNKLLGLWAAGLIGLEGAQANDLAVQVVQADFEQPGDNDVLEAVQKALAQAGIQKTEIEIRAQMDQLMNVARQQITSE